MKRISIGVVAASACAAWAACAADGRVAATDGPAAGAALQEGPTPKSAPQAPAAPQGANGACGPIQKLLPPDGLPGDFFGWSAAMSGDVIAIGARNHPFSNPIDPNYQAGAVYVFRKEGASWVLDAKLTAPSGDDHKFDAFGHSVALDRGLLAIGAPGDDGEVPRSDRGAVYVFRKDGSAWTFEQKIARAAEGGSFLLGQSVAVKENALLAGADDATSGTAFVYRRSGTTWSQEAQLKPANPEVVKFGWAVSLEQDTALVGAPGTQVAGTSIAGTAHVYRRVGAAWTESQEIPNPEPRPFDHFGDALVLAGRQALIGSPFAPLDGTFDVGAVYAFERTAPGTYALTAELRPSPAKERQHFGNAVAMIGAKAVIGSETYTIDLATCASLQMCNEGAAYQFNQVSGAWGQAAQHVNPEPTPIANFGHSVAFGSHVVIGVHRDDQLGQDVGAAWVYSVCP